MVVLLQQEGSGFKSQVGQSESFLCGVFMHSLCRF